VGLVCAEVKDWESCIRLAFFPSGLAKSAWCEVRQKNSGQKNRKQDLVSAQTVVKLFVRRVSNLILDCGRSPRQIIRRLTAPI
jgi:hypothetical protein